MKADKIPGQNPQKVVQINTGTRYSSATVEVLKRSRSRNKITVVMAITPNARRKSRSLATNQYKEFDDIIWQSSSAQEIELLIGGVGNKEEWWWYLKKDIVLPTTIRIYANKVFKDYAECELNPRKAYKRTQS